MVNPNRTKNNMSSNIKQNVKEILTPKTGNREQQQNQHSEKVSNDFLGEGGGYGTTLFSVSEVIKIFQEYH